MRQQLIWAACALAFACSGAQAHSSSFQAVLSGANEVNGGDPDGTGLAKISIDYDTNVLTYDISFANLDSVSAAHIHTGAAGVNGPVSIPFTVPAGSAGSGSLKGTITGNPNSLFVTEASASGFYVNLHTSAFGGGAIRGQLASVPEPQTYVLMLTGLMLVGGMATRRRGR